MINPPQSIWRPADGGSVRRSGTREGNQTNDGGAFTDASATRETRKLNQEQLCYAAYRELYHLD